VKNAAPLPPGLYGADQLAPGDWFMTDACEVTPAMITAFAALTGDRTDLHLSDAAGRAAGFGGQVAHGLLVLALVEGLKSTAPARIDGVAALGWDWSFRQPVLADAVIRARVTVLARRVAGPDRSLLELEVEVLSGDAVVQRGQTRMMVRRTASSPATPHAAPPLR
jgi:3-hydroxybutyryl-CoA dehydratase